MGSGRIDKDQMKEDEIAKDKMVEGEVAIYPSGQEQNTISQIKEKEKKWTTFDERPFHFRK